MPNNKPQITAEGLVRAPDVEVLTEEVRTRISTDVPVAPNVELKNVFIPFDGKWMPDSDPIEIGPKNYKTLQNYRYAGDEIIHLETALGYSKINAVSLDTSFSYPNIRNGHQLRSEYTKKTYVLVHTEHDTPASNYSKVYQNQTAIPSAGNFGVGTITATTIAFNDNGGSPDTITDSGDAFLTSGFLAAMSITVTGSTSGTNDGTYTIASVVAGTITLATGSLSATQGATPSVTILGNALLHTDSAYNLEGRFSDAPGSQVVYCNGEESCIWAGEEMPCAGFYTFFAPKLVGGASKIDFVDGGGSSDTITDDDSGFVDAGFEIGHTVIISGTTNNNISVKLTNVAAGTLTVPTGTLTGEVNQTATIRVGYKTAHEGATDYTEALNNTIDSAAESATIDGDTTGNYWIVLSTRPLQGVKYNLRTVNDTGSATTTCKYWNGYSFVAVSNASDGTDSSGSMKSSGTFSFDSTASVAKPLHWEGLYLYAYLFELSAGTFSVYNVTVDAPFQAIVDVWDGVYRQPIQFHVGRGLTTTGGAVAGSGTLTIYSVTESYGFGTTWHNYRVVVCSSAADWGLITVGSKIIANAETRYVTSKTTAYGDYTLELNANVTWSAQAFTFTNTSDTVDIADYKDFTLEVNEVSYADYPIGAVIDGMTVSADHILIGFDERMSGIQFDMIAEKVNTNTAQMQISYWDGSDWQGVLMTDSTQGLPGTQGINKSFNRSGLVSWHPPSANGEFRQTIFGVTAYYYYVTVNAALTGTAGDDNAELIIDVVKGIPAQTVVNPFKFSVNFKNRLMLCGFTKGGEGNRIDYSVKDAPDVHNGEESSMDGIQSLYIGGKEDLTGGVEIFNRFGSNIISSLLLFKKNETYLLTGDGPDNYKVYTISRTVGCPVPLTLAAAETGYTFAEEINRNIAIWVSYAGPMIFDGAAIVAIPGIKTYFDPAKTARVQTSVIERCRGWYDATYKEYDFVIPSASGATNCNVWIVYDLVRKRLFEKELGASEIPQAAWPVYDTDGVQYIYAGIDDGNVMRLENGALWSDDSATPMAPVIEPGDFFPSGDVWHKTRLRRLKVVAKKISEASKNLEIYHYPDSTPHVTITGSTDIGFVDSDPDTITDGGSGFVTAGFKAGMIIHVSAGSTLNLNKSFTIATVAAGTLTLISSDEVVAEASQSAKIDSFKILTEVDLDSGHEDVVRATQAVNLFGWSHRFRFSLDSGFSTETQFQPVGYGFQFYVERTDEQLQ